ncbi:MAG: carboxypeptidase-like regulatory domain-containing protein [Bacteroidetes bacterium]|nr:carboxypeptidase-like regulatory domain-containing protein [Bacteroidota bacterium]
MKKLVSCFWLVLSLLTIQVSGVTLSGLVTDEKNEPLPFVSVYIPGTTNGTTSNIEGKYFLELNPGSYTVACKMMGYGQVTKQITISANTKEQCNFQLRSESFNLKEVVVNSDAEDPAYAIIRKAQKKRAYYRDQIERYSCDAYVKSTQRLTKSPKSFFGQKVDLGDMVDSATKMFYLSESVSHLFFNQPDNYREEMISSKVSGSPQTYSFNQAQDVLLNLYDNLVYLGNLTPRGVISPISANALFSYKYRFEGSFMENGALVNKISVIPKRLTDPVFTGTIYICDDSWRIHSADLFITRAQQMEFVDTFRVKRNFHCRYR